MAQSGNLIGNLINWYIGYIIMAIFAYVGNILGIIGMWQFGVDGVTGIYDSFKMADVGDAYTREMTIAYWIANVTLNRYQKISLWDTTPIDLISDSLIAYKTWLCQGFPVQILEG